MRYIDKALGAAALLALAACSGIDVQPQIETFAEATEAAAKAVKAKADAPGVEKKADAAHAKVWAEEGWQIAVTGCNGAVNLTTPSTAEQIAAKGGGAPDFDDACDLGPRDANNAPPPPDTKADLDPAVRVLNAKRVALSLGGYAEALGALAASDMPDKAGEALSRAVTAARKLGDAVVTAGGDKISAERGQVLSTGGTLLTDLGREAFHAYRFAQLKAAVRAADPAVQGAAFYLAEWRHELDKVTLRPRYAALTDKVGAYNRAVTDGQGAKAEKLAAEILGERRALRKAENAAGWRAFNGIGAAHAALLAALENPRDIDQLVAANTRVIELIGAVDAFVKAVEDDQDK